METKKYKLPKEFATKWVEALRSGEYQQTKKNLKNDAGYRCLGVACCTIGNTEGLYGKAYPDSKLLPIEGIYERYEDDEGALFSVLANLNDGGQSFNQISDWIEANVEFI